MKKIMALLLTVTFLFNTNAFADSARDANYGVWESYGASWKHPLQYPDFRLEFIDKIEGEFYPGSKERRLGDIYTFSILNKEKKQTIKWTSGAGDLTPTKFSIDDQTFYLEMIMSDISDDKAPDYQVLIWKEDEYLQRMKVRRNELNLRNN